MQEFQIENNVKVPPRGLPYPFYKMNVGDSFRVMPEWKRRISSAASYYGKVYGGKFIMRSMLGGEIRIWRIK